MLRVAGREVALPVDGWAAARACAAAGTPVSKPSGLEKPHKSKSFFCRPSLFRAPTAARLSNMAAALALSILPLMWLLFLLFGAVTGANEPPSCAPLPDPAPLNDFLLHNSQGWTNPLFKGEPHPLQLTKCKSLSGSPQYEFYQVETPSRACKVPPSLVKSPAASRKETDTKGYFVWAWYLGWFLSVTWNVVSGVTGLTTAELCLFALSWVVFMMVLAVVGGAWFWVRRVSTELCQSFEAARSPPDLSTSTPDTIEDDVSKGSVTSERTLSLWWRAFKALFTFLWAAVGALICGAAVLASALAVLSIVAAPILAVGFVICQESNGPPQREGTPLSLPDPNQAGLNHFVSSQLGGTLNLTLCTTQNLQFYVACPAAMS